MMGLIVILDDWQQWLITTINFEPFFATSKFTVIINKTNQRRNWNILKLPRFAFDFFNPHYSYFQLSHSLVEQVLTDWQSQTRPSLRLTISLFLQSLSIKIYSKSLFLLISVVHDNIFELDQWFHLHLSHVGPHGCGLEEPLAHRLLISRCYEVSRDLVQHHQQTNFWIQWGLSVKVYIPITRHHQSTNFCRRYAPGAIDEQ